MNRACWRWNWSGMVVPYGVLVRFVTDTTVWQGVTVLTEVYLLRTWETPAQRTGCDSSMWQLASLGKGKNNSFHALADLGAVPLPTASSCVSMGQFLGQNCVLVLSLPPTKEKSWMTATGLCCISDNTHIHSLGINHPPPLCLLWKSTDCLNSKGWSGILPDLKCSLLLHLLLNPCCWNSHWSVKWSSTFTSY